MTLRGAKVLWAPALLLLVLGAALPAAAQQKVKLEIKAKQGALSQYTMRVGGTVDMDMADLPFPKSKMKIENLKALAQMQIYFETQNVEDKIATYDVKAMLDKIVLGDLLALDGLGMKSTDLSPSITMTIAPTGKITDVTVAEIELPGGGAGKKMFGGLDSMGLGLTDMKSILPMIVGLFPTIFPETELAPGDTWKQEINFDDMGMGGFLPRIPFEFKLVSIKDGVADITFTMIGEYDGAVIKSFLALIPEIPLGSDVVKINDVNLKVKWNGAGTMKFSVAAGRIEDVTLKSDIDILLGWNANFQHQDKTTEPWNADGKGKIALDFGLKYAGAPTAEDVKQLFPPPETTGDEDKSDL